jgi:hypothetical protein
MISTILLSQNDCYVSEDGKLPKRPIFDKELLNAFVKNQKVSKKGLNSLPPSMQKNLTIVENENITIGITIPEIASSNVIIIIRSDEILENGKIFRLDNFNLLVKTNKIEIWIKK